MDVNEIQSKIDELFSDDNEDIERSYELYIISSDKFTKAIVNARKKLSLESFISKKNGTKAHAKDFKHLMNYDDRSVVDIVVKESSGLSKEKFYEVVDVAVNEAGLPAKWREYIAIYIIKQRPPQFNVFPPNRYISVEEIEDDTVTLKIKKGLRYEQYLKSWQALSVFLGKGTRKLKTPNEETRIRDLQMHGKRETYDSTYRQLADEYINSAINIDDAKDTVKKAYKRQKKLFDEGTDLTQ